MSDARLFRRTDPDFPTTKAAHLRLVIAGRVVGEGPLSKPVQHTPQAPAPKLLKNWWHAGAACSECHR